VPQYLIHYDGLCEPVNPNGYACFGVVAYQDDSEVYTAATLVGVGACMSNNVAEYAGLLHALRYATQHGWRGVAVRGDSKLTVEQVNGRWGVKAEHLRSYVAECKVLLHALGGSLSWVPRDQNERADALSRQAYDEARAAARHSPAQPASR
jgi:ribonuclease HI